MRGTRRWATTRRSSMQVILERSVDTFSGFLEPACRGDRKSTRLNSSHLVISYAVFCLKKKKRHLKLSILKDPLTVRRGHQRQPLLVLYDVALPLTQASYHIVSTLRQLYHAHVVFHQLT